MDLPEVMRWAITVILPVYRGDGTLPYGGINALVLIQHANPTFHWSTNKRFEAAIDLGFLKDRINISGCLLPKSLRRSTC